ncbi:Transmembrane protein 93-like protein [Dinothrombium tinctorium]|uniref:ER membrane protein complex subunit 6 n=1 Tax=Dinothrombium tinctorium TaxID=1965070 RepID=A0A3S4QTR5_9ACAR|nr:Transmembrane protein 93-like protein [Dinothrombium tinctorium]
MRTRKEKSGEVVAYSEAAIRHNHSILEYCRTSMSALSGFTAGVIGLTGILGFVFYFLVAIVLWLIILVKVGSSWDKYFRGRLNLLTNGLGGGLFTYVLFWTFLYGMVHVY